MFPVKKKFVVFLLNVLLSIILIPLILYFGLSMKNKIRDRRNTTSLYKFAATLGYEESDKITQYKFCSGSWNNNCEYVLYFRTKDDKNLLGNVIEHNGYNVSKNSPNITSNLELLELNNKIEEKIYIDNSTKTANPNLGGGAYKWGLISTKTTGSRHIILFDTVNSLETIMQNGKILEKNIIKIIYSE